MHLQIEKPVLPDAVVEERLSDSWLDTMAKMNKLSEKNKRITEKMFSDSILRKGFFSLNNPRPTLSGRRNQSEIRAPLDTV